MNRVLVFAFLFALSAPYACQTTRHAVPLGSPRATGYRVVVAVVVDQLAAWVMAERAQELPAEGGFARLAREGLYARQLEYQHAVTETAPGHAALFTGRVPRETGIYSNEILRPGEAEAVSILRERGTGLVAVDGAPIEGEGSSLAALHADVDTVADVWRAARPDGRVFSFSLKDRGALFGGGRHPDLVLWLDTKSARMVSSTAFAQVGTLPAWVAAAGGSQAVAKLLQTPWTLDDQERAWVARHAYPDDDHPGESTHIFGSHFPHTIASAAVLRATPQGDELVLALARAAVQDGTNSSRPVFLALSLSANDYIGHLFGPQSWEAWDELLRLDQALARFLAFLDQSVGTNAYAVMLTGDHGINPLPELAPQERSWCASPDLWQRPCAKTRRVRGAAKAGSPAAEQTVRGVLESALNREFGRPGPWVAGVAGPFVYLTKPLAAAVDQARLVVVAQTALGQAFGVRHVLDLHQVARTCSPERADALLCRSLPVDIAADLFVELDDGDFFDAELDPGLGANHGSPRRFDRSVPLYLRAPGCAPAGTLLAEPLRFDAFTRTLASLLDLPRDSIASAGRDLCRR
ncbi:MAG: alkaline phosphatase family protein [Polyangia bacterium]